MFNGVIWKSIQLALSSLNLPLSHWEKVLTDVLHAQRSMLSTATGCTPHERMFSYRRKTTAGTSLPTWLRPGPVLVRRHVRGKYDPLVEDAELINANPTYATVRLQSGREIDVNIRDVAPLHENVHIHLCSLANEFKIESHHLLIVCSS